MKYIPYGRQFIDKDDIREVVKVLKSDWLTQGPMVQRFEEALAAYCGVKYVVAVSSGTAALHLACLVSGLKKGDEAITSPITFLATSNAVLYTGARPVFADIDYDAINISPGEIEKNITKKTKVILPVHFAGLPCDIPEIAKIAKKHNLVVIEDACHALGAEYKANGKWIKVGSCKHSDMTIFSFHPVKHITTGEGGAIATDSKRLYERLKALRTHGVYKDKNTTKNGAWYYEMRELGFNYRLTDIQCALGLSQLKKLDRFIRRRREIVEKYEESFMGNEFFSLPEEDGNVKSSWHLYVIRLKDKYKKSREEIFHKLRNKGLGIQVHYIPVYQHPYYKQSGYGKVICPNAEDFYQKEISIPLHYSISVKDIGYVIKTLLTVFKELA